MPPFDAVRQFLRNGQFTDCRIHAAFSGGADSVCLLHILHSLQDELHLDVRAIHIQHHLRGEESLRDEQFCRDFCRNYSIPLTVVPVDVQGYAQMHRLSVETAARECRYAAFAEYCDGYTATAHTASDHLETLLLRMTRGAGLHGLCGIPPVRDRFIRPLLHVTRDEIMAYLREYDIPHVEDSTNQEDFCRRNLLRHHVIPILKECNPSAEHTCANMTEDLRLDADFLTMQADAAYEASVQSDGSLKGLAAHHPAIRRRCIARLLQAYGLSSRVNILTAEEILLHGGSAELQRSGIRIRSGRDTLWLEMPQVEVPEKLLQIGENCIFPGMIVKAELVSRDDPEKFARIYTLFANSVLDYAIIRRNAVLHSRKAGLRMKPAGRAHSVSIKKWLNAEVPPTERVQLHYLSDENGLLWAQGLGVAEHAAVTERTETMLLLRIITK